MRVHALTSNPNPDRPGVQTSTKTASNAHAERIYRGGVGTKMGPVHKVDDFLESLEWP
jgi:hypothetical protein